MKRTIRKVLCLLLLLLLFPMQTRGAVESETTAQSEKLRLDNENRYEGMEKAYQDGYEPEVSGESVSVILPLMWNGKNEVDTITASFWREICQARRIHHQVVYSTPDVIKLRKSVRRRYLNFVIVEMVIAVHAIFRKINQNKIVFQ